MDSAELATDMRLIYWPRTRFTGNVFNLLVQVAINRSKLGKEMRALATERAGTK